MSDTDTQMGSTSAAAGSTMISSGMSDNIIVTHTDGETDLIEIIGTDADETFVAQGDGIGDPGANIAGINYEISIQGGAGNDTFIADGGNTIVNGGLGDDTYIWKSGNLVIDQTGVEDSLVNLVIDNEGHTLSDFLFFPVDLGLGNPGTNDLFTISTASGEQIIMGDQFLNFDPNNPIDKVVELTVNDGPTVLLQNFETWFVSTNGADDVVTNQYVFADGGHDTITGTADDDLLVGGQGNDVIDGLAGDDFVDGGVGDDTLIYTYEGGGNADFYIGATGVDTLQVNLTQAEFDSFAVRDALIDLTTEVPANADAGAANGYIFTSEALGLTVQSMEVVEVYVDGALVTDIPALDLGPSLSGTGTASVGITTTTIPFEFSPPPQDFPDLTEGAAVDPPELINGTERSYLTFANDHDVEVNFVTEGAGYKNTLGYYTVSADGEIENVSFLAENASGTGSGVHGGGSFNTGDLIADLGTLEAGTEIGFFIVANGFSVNNQYGGFDLDAGTLAFKNNDTGDAAKITDSHTTTDLVLVNADGSESTIGGNVYHASSSSLNADGIVHSISGINDAGNLQISFEDLFSLGDADFEDIIIELDIADAVESGVEKTLVAADFTVADEDDDTISEMTISISDGGQAGDMLCIDMSTLAGSNVTVNQIDDTTIILSGDDAASIYEAALQSLAYGSSSDEPMAGDRTVSISVTDQDGLMDSADIVVSVDAAPEMDDVLTSDSDLMFAAGSSDMPDTSSDVMGALPDTSDMPDMTQPQPDIL